MSSNPAFETKGKQLINNVDKGMPVFDRAGREIGKVDGVFMPVETENLQGLEAKPEVVVAPAAVTAPVLPAMVAVDTSPAAAAGDLLPADDTFPKVLRSRLLNNGFVRIHGGLLKHHRYAMPDQIEAVDLDRVRLKVAEEDLIKH